MKCLNCFLTKSSFLHNIGVCVIHARSEQRRRTGRVADPEAAREWMPSAGSILRRRSCEVRPGADPVKAD